MIYSKEYNYLCFQIPHTGSTSMGRWCVSKYNGKKAGLKHQSLIPKEINKNVFKFCLIRNPYDRLFTWWWFDKEKGSNSSFVDFLKFIIDRKDINANDPGLKNPRFYMNQSSWIKETGAKWLKLEDVIKEPEKCLIDFLPFVNKKNYKHFPHYNKTKTRPRIHLKEYFKNDLENVLYLVRKYCTEDFETFGYTL